MAHDGLDFYTRQGSQQKSELSKTLMHDVGLSAQTKLYLW